ncbi:tyrosine protein kinase [Serratia fonticola]|uniref:tyrosine-protein kinase Wzc n=1 Tax=Serratia fonticola TaxID=47917 RepID=UPI000742CEC6|nr:tyrosine-protein kinase Wzc [Serratia fonticola]ALX94357.1 tyrosine protein kinase [Serratia fonticola]CAI1563078.1 Tyrosine-protein kinase wzc [Serratia fonticola]
MSEKIRTSPNSSEKKDEIDFGLLLGRLLDNRWLICSVMSLFMLAGVVYILFSTPIYRADAIVQVEQNTGSTLLNNLSEILPSSQPPSAAEIELIRSRMVLGRTIDKLGLEIEVSQNYFPIFGKGLARLLKKEPGEILVSQLSVPDSKLEQPLELNVTGESTYSLEFDDVKVDGKVGQVVNKDGVEIKVDKIEAPSGTSFTIVKNSKMRVINDLLDRLDISDKGKDTGVLSLSLVGENPAKIKEILNSIADDYLRQNVERKSAEAEKSLIFLKEQLPIVRVQLDSAESKLNGFRQQNESVDLSLEAKSALDSMVMLDGQLNELTFKESEISKLYTKEHPAYRSLIEKRHTLEKEKEKLNAKIGSLPKTQQEILRLTRDVKVSQEVYMQLLNKQQELGINKASTVGNVRIVDDAMTQPKAVKPQKMLLLVLSVVIGGFVSVVIVVVSTLLHKGIESAEQLESVGISVYASIPLSEWQKKKDTDLVQKYKGRKSNTRSTSLLAVGNPADLAIEAIRSLRTTLHFAMLEAKNNIIMITGASPGIGKSFVSTNLAAVIAMSGQKTLIIDGDMRKGYMHEIFNTGANNGLSDILSGQLEKDSAPQRTDVPLLDFISRGIIPPNPAELLMHERFDGLIEWAKNIYDIIIIDTPPILAVTDAAIIGRHVGTSFLVARFDINTVKEVDICVQRLYQNGVDIKGAIINGVIRKASNYYAYGNYGYYSYDSDKN